MRNFILCSLQLILYNISRVLKSWRMRWAGHEVNEKCMQNFPRETSNYRPLAWPNRRWEDNIKMDTRNTGCERVDLGMLTCHYYICYACIRVMGKAAAVCCEPSLRWISRTAAVLPVAQCVSGFICPVTTFVSRYENKWSNAYNWGFSTSWVGVRANYPYIQRASYLGINYIFTCLSTKWLGLFHTYIVKQVRNQLDAWLPSKWSL
jgi:hypothetical protein